MFHHTAITYGASGSWYYQDGVKDGIAPVLLTLFTAVNQAFFLGLFFFISGYFTPSSYDRKGARSFLSDRLFRLGIPILLYLFGIGPVVVYLTGYRDQLSFGAFYQEKIMTFRIINWGPLWFAEALLYFSVLYVLWRLLATKFRLALQAGPSSGERRSSAFPSSRSLIWLGLLTGVAAFLIRLVQPVGSNILGMQFGYFASYMVLFIAGIEARRRGWLELLMEAQARRWLRISLGVIVALPIFMVTQGALSGKELHVNGGWNLQAFVYAMWEPFVAIGLCLGMLHGVRKRWHTPSAWSRHAADSAFGAYVLHPIVIVPIAMLIHDVMLPPLLKWIIVGVFGSMIAFLLAFIWRKLPFLGRIL